MEKSPTSLSREAAGGGTGRIMDLLLTGVSNPSYRLRFLPVATVLAMRGFETTTPSWAGAAAVHGVPLRTYLGRMLLPVMVPSLTAAALLVALLASADVSTILLLQPPGEASFSVAIFTVMANPPESLVASLCVTYIAGAAVILMTGWQWAGGWVSHLAWMPHDASH